MSHLALVALVVRDYDAALDESGRPQPKYFTFKDAIAAHFPDLTLPEVPITAPAIAPLGGTLKTSLLAAAGVTAAV